jgi:hypothetical protein
MKERLVYFPFYFEGTAAAGGTASFTAWDPLTFYNGAVYTLSLEGGTVTVSCENTGQGTATLYTNALGVGSAYVGTAACGAGTTLKIKGGGTCDVYICGTATSATQMAGYVAFLAGEDG